MTDRFDYVGDNLDDVVVEDVKMFRLEHMDGKNIWMMCYREGKPDIRFSLTSKTKITGSHVEEK